MQQIFMNRWHTHRCAHGSYVLDGTLVTHHGSYPPGHFGIEHVFAD